MICLVKMVLSAKQTAAASAATWPGLERRGAGLGDDEHAERSRGPAASTRVRVRRSPSRNGASSATQIGLVNSSATSWLSGIVATAKNQRFWPA